MKKNEIKEETRGGKRARKKEKNKNVGVPFGKKGENRIKAKSKVTKNNK